MLLVVIFIVIYDNIPLSCLLLNLIIKSNVDNALYRSLNIIERGKVIIVIKLSSDEIIDLYTNHVSM